jgi:hypothetical protein
MKIDLASGDVDRGVRRVAGIGPPDFQHAIIDLPALAPQGGVQRFEEILDQRVRKHLKIGAIAPAADPTHSLRASATDGDKDQGRDQRSLGYNVRHRRSTTTSVRGPGNRVCGFRSFMRSSSSSSGFGSES